MHIFMDDLQAAVRLQLTILTRSYPILKFLFKFTCVVLLSCWVMAGRY